jgi:acyl-CoA synthetase (AMP-forming)/AMP-acid ligase II
VAAVLSTHPSVHLAQVVGRSSQRYGEVPVAFVELIPGSTCTAGELTDYCAGNLASYKVPARSAS